MLSLQRHRGPDGSDAWVDGPVGLGHQLLCTTPESLEERQPCFFNGVAIIADARIDNREDLGAQLGHSESASDPEWILRAYDRWGLECLQRLEGDFAFAIWDPHQRRLVCARDRFGVKPFYYFRSARYFAFASQVSALLGLDEVPRRLNETRVADFLVPMLEDLEITFYEGVLRLPPGHLLTSDQGGQSRLQAYWTLGGQQELRLASDGEYEEAFRERFLDAVRTRLRSAFPIGSMLSGGLDSSAIACTASLLHPEGVHTFSALFPGHADSDERPYIDAVLNRGGFEPHAVETVPLAPMGDLLRSFKWQDEVPWIPNLFWLQGLYEAAGKGGVRCLLDGTDGDTTVSHGYHYLGELFRAGRWWSLAREIAGLKRNFPRRSAWHFFRTYALRPSTPELVVRAWRRVRREKRPWWRIGSIVSSSFAERIGLEDRARRLAEAPIPRSARDAHRIEVTSGLNAYVLEVLDRAASAAGVEPRYPFFDRRLVEFCVALPAAQKLRRGWTRHIMRRALTRTLPEAISKRGGKADLSPTFVRGLLEKDRCLLEDVIVRDSHALEPYVDLQALRSTYRRYCATGGKADSMTIWKSVALAQWLKWAGFADPLKPNDEKHRRVL